MPLALIVVAVVLAHTAYNGTRLNISLAALASGASPLTVGVLMSLIAALPMLLGVPAGRFVDRVGVRVPMIAAVCLLIAAVIVPGIFTGVVPLYIAAAGIGSGFSLFHICAQHMVGEMSNEENRRDNFGWLALGFGISNSIGPTFAGICIDTLGNRATFWLLALFATSALALLVARRASLAHT